MGNRVQSFSHEVGRVIIRWYMRKGKGLGDAMSSCEMVSNVHMLSLRIVDRILSNVVARGIICHTRYAKSVMELCECVEVPDCLRGCSGKGHIFCFCGRRGNGLLFLREPGYSTTIEHKSITRYGTTGITTRSISESEKGMTQKRLNQD